MIVCVCRRVNDAAIATAVANGARSLEEIAAATGAGTDCGCCRDTIVEKIAVPEPPCCATPCAGCPRARARAA